MALEITEIPDSIVAGRGENVTLTCSGTGETLVRISWVAPSGETQSNSTDEGRTLVPDFIWTAPDFVIYDISADDGGTYTCIAENEQGSVNASVVVYVTPYFTTEPSDIFTTNGSVENVTCMAEAFPPPDIWWVASNNSCTQIFASGSGSDETIMYEHQNVMVFDPVLFGDEDYVYCCYAYNGYGEIYTSVNVTGRLSY